MSTLQKIQSAGGAAIAIAGAWVLWGWPAALLCIGIFGCADVAFDAWAKRRGS